MTYKYIYTSYITYQYANKMINPNKTEKTICVSSANLFTVIYPSIFVNELEKIAQAKPSGKEKTNLSLKEMYLLH